MSPDSILEEQIKSLPHHFQRKSGVMYFLSLFPSIDGQTWNAQYWNDNYKQHSVGSFADTPLKALLKLVLALPAKHLTKEGEVK